MNQYKENPYNSADHAAPTQGAVAAPTDVRPVPSHTALFCLVTQACVEV